MWCFGRRVILIINFHCVLCLCVLQSKGSGCPVSVPDLHADKVTFVAEDGRQQRDQLDASSNERHCRNMTDNENNNVKPCDLASRRFYDEILPCACDTVEHLECRYSPNTHDQMIAGICRDGSETQNTPDQMFANFSGTEAKESDALRDRHSNDKYEERIWESRELKTYANWKPHGRMIIKFTSLRTCTNRKECEIDQVITESSNPKSCTNVKRYECNVCYRLFTDGSNLRKHRRIHTGDRRYSCDVCHMSFTQNGSLTSHKRTHTGDRPYSCDVCQKAFRFSSNLIKHKRIHGIGIKTNSCLCDVCGKTLANPTVLAVHKRIHTGQKPYTCYVCDKAFSDSSQVAAHIRVHTRSRPFKCEICDMSFSQSSVLQRHRRIHAGIRPHVCEICQKAFTQASHLNTHMRTHTGECPFVCEQCNSAFNRLCYLRRHKCRSHFS